MLIGGISSPTNRGPKTIFFRRLNDDFNSLYLSTYKPKTCFSSSNIAFIINGCPIKVVDGAAHLGHVISYDSDDSLDILRSRDKLIIKINNVLITFYHLDSIVNMIYSKAIV